MSTEKEQLRKLFVDHYKHMPRKLFFTALINELSEVEATGKTFASSLRDLVAESLMRMESPAQVWDNISDPFFREVLARALASGLKLKSESLTDEASSALQSKYELVDLIEEIDWTATDDATDADDNTIPISAAAPSASSDASDIPPDTLYHGTVRAFLPSIQSLGLVPKRRKVVTLYEDPEEAKAVPLNRRHTTDPDEVVLLSVEAKQLFDESGGSCRFEKKDHGYGDVWEVLEVAPEYLDEVQV